jgi:hypothetical protein
LALTPASRRGLAGRSAASRLRVKCCCSSAVQPCRGFRALAILRALRANLLQFCVSAVLQLEPSLVGSYGASRLGVALRLGSGAMTLAIRRPATRETAVSSMVNAVSMPATVLRSNNEAMLR